MFLNCPKLMSTCRSSGGRSFQILGPATEKSLCRRNCSVFVGQRMFCGWLIEGDAVRCQREDGHHWPSTREGWPRSELYMIQASLNRAKEPWGWDPPREAAIWGSVRSTEKHGSQCYGALRSKTMSNGDSGTATATRVQCCRLIGVTLHCPPVKIRPTAMRPFVEILWLVTTFFMRW